MASEQPAKQTKPTKPTKPAKQPRVPRSQQKPEAESPAVDVDKQSKPKTRNWTFTRILLVVFIAAWVGGTIFGVYTMWPGDKKPNISPNFYTSFSMSHAQVEGTVLFTQPGSCTSSEVGRVFDTSPRESPGSDNNCQWYITQIDSGTNKGQRTLLINSHNPGEPELHKNDRILLIEDKAADGSMSYGFSDFQRTYPLLLWGLIIAAAIAGFALIRGVRALLGLGITLVVVVLFTVRILLLGASPISAAVVSGAAILLLVVFMVHGFNWKSASALGGTLIALVIAAWLATIAIDNNELRGLGNSDNLSIIVNLPDVSVKGLMLCGFIIGALGVLNDVAISQASTINELADLDPQASPARLFLGAMKVGRDHIASMVYTLVLTYTGASLPLLLLLSVSERPLVQILTSDVMATEMLRSGIGALALTLTVPITTVIAAYTVPNTSNKADATTDEDADSEAAEDTAPTTA
ncbi:YibE/F family protein [Corynebacterium matruchotii]